MNKSDVHLAIAGALEDLAHSLDRMTDGRGHFEWAKALQLTRDQARGVASHQRNHATVEANKERGGSQPGALGEAETKTTRPFPPRREDLRIAVLAFNQSGYRDWVRRHAHPAECYHFVTSVEAARGMNFRQAEMADGFWGRLDAAEIFRIVGERIALTRMQDQAKAATDGL